MSHIDVEALVRTVVLFCGDVFEQIAGVDKSSGKYWGNQKNSSTTEHPRLVRQQAADDYFVFIISDANLEGYGVSAEALSSALLSDRRVNAYAFFIAEPDVARDMVYITV